MKNHLNTWLWASVGLLLLAFILRLANTLVLPLFVDEATHIYYAQFQILEPNPFFGAQNNKWLYLASLRLLRPLGPEAPWLGRFISAVVSLITVACAISIGRLLDRPITGLVAGLFYTVIPLAVWHERQALADPMMSAMTALVMLLSLRLALKPRLWLAALLSVTLCGALIAKLAAAPYLTFPVAAALLMFSRSANWKQALSYAAVASVLVIPLYVIYEQIRTGFGYGSLDTHGASIDNILLFDLANPDAQATLTRNFIDYLDTMWVYIGPILLLATVSSLVWAALNKQRWEILLLWIPALAFAALPIITVPVTGSGWNPPRYYLMQALPIAILAAMSLDLFSQAASSRWYGSAFVGVLIVSLAVSSDLAYIINPLQATLTEVDQDNYWAFSSGYGRIDAIQEVLAIHRSDPDARLNIIGRGYDMIWFRAYIGPDVGGFETLEQDGDEQEDAQQGRVARWLVDGDRVFYFEEVNRSPVAENPHGAEVTLVGDYQYRERAYRLYEATGATKPLAEEIFLITGRDPQFMADDLQALGQQLDASDAAQVIVFPPTHASALQTQTNATATGLPVTTWPFDPKAVSAALDDVVEAEVVDVVLSNPEESDSQRVVQMTLADTLYPLGEANFFGLLRRQRYINSPTDPNLLPINAEFEGVIQLIAGGRVDLFTNCCHQLYQFTWQTREPIQDSFIVFTHIVDEQGTLVAQRDAIPGNSLYPLTSWAVSQTITDQFALDLPDTLPSGHYEVRVGLYMPESGLRLRLTSAGPNQPMDYVVVDTFTLP